MVLEVVSTPSAHPGEILTEILDDNGLSQSELASHLGIAHSYINDICRGRRGISAVMAIRLARALNQTPEFWLNLQKSWELSQAKKEEEIEIQPLRLRV